MKRYLISLTLLSLLMSPLTMAHSFSHKHHTIATATALPTNSTFIDFNTATANELSKLNGIGPKKAAAIVAYREQHGHFEKLSDLTGIKGISQQWVHRFTEKNAGKFHFSPVKSRPN